MLRVRGSDDAGEVQLELELELELVGDSKAGRSLPHRHPSILSGARTPCEHLIIENGDVLIVRTSGGRPNARRSVYQFHVQGEGLTPDRFAAFEHVFFETFGRVGE